MRAGTIIASNYLEMARLLARSFLEHHPDDRFTILVVDERPIDAELDARIDIVRLADIGLDPADIDMMRSIYDVMELATAVKPRLLQHLLHADEIACYLDPDIYVYGSFTDVVEPARDVGIVLTPHVLLPIPRDGCHPNEREIMQSGVMNLGFIAVGRTATGFLEWWQERLMVDAISAVGLNLFTDQRWIDWVPALFPHVVCRDPGMNVAWWNIHERRLDRDGRRVTVDDLPLRCFHFSGYSPANADTLSKHQLLPARASYDVGSVVRDLAHEYGDRLVASGHLDRIRTPYEFAINDDGIVLSNIVRTTVREGLLGGCDTGSEVARVDPAVPAAFGERAGELRSWLLGADPGSGGVPRVALVLWRERPDLRAEFPEPTGSDADGYLDWLAHDPGAEAALPGIVTIRPRSRQPARGGRYGSRWRSLVARQVGRIVTAGDQGRHS